MPPDQKQLCRRGVLDPAQGEVDRRVVVISASRTRPFRGLLHDHLRVPFPRAAVLEAIVLGQEPCLGAFASRHF